MTITLTEAEFNAIAAALKNAGEIAYKASVGENDVMCSHAAQHADEQCAFAAMLLNGAAAKAK